MSGHDVLKCVCAKTEVDRYKSCFGPRLYPLPSYFFHLPRPPAKPTLGEALLPEQIYSDDSRSLGHYK